MECHQTTFPWQKGASKCQPSYRGHLSGWQKIHTSLSQGDTINTGHHFPTPKKLQCVFQQLSSLNTKMHNLMSCTAYLWHSQRMLENAPKSGLGPITSLNPWKIIWESSSGRARTCFHYMGTFKFMIQHSNHPCDFVWWDKSRLHQW